MDAWHRMLAKEGLPAAGCFKATYPSIKWHRTACAAPPHILFPAPPSRRKGLAQNVGDGHDFTADTTPYLISTAIGAFPSVKGVKSVRSEGCCGDQGVNAYTLQLNSNFFTTAACGGLQHCLGWSQFVYFNPTTVSGDGALFIQDWLVSTSGSFSSCPPSAGWENVGIGCVQNSPGAVYLANVPVKDLGEMILTGVAASSGDSIYMSVGTTEYGMQNIQGDGITDLSEHWEGAEFNVIGAGGGDIADFTGKSKITASIETDDGQTTAPTCPANSGTTGETNNLNFGPAPKTLVQSPYPFVEFTMGRKSKGTPSCATGAGTGT